MEKEINWVTCYMEFCMDLMKGSYSENTRSSYENDIKDYISFLVKRGIKPAELTEGTVAAYFRTKTELQTSTKNRKLSALRSFHLFLFKRGIVSDLLTYKGETQEPLRSDHSALTEEEVNAVFACIAEEAGTHALRDALLLKSMYHCGMKISEVSSLRYQDINLEMEYMEIRSLRSRHRAIPIPLSWKETYLLYKAQQSDRSHVGEEADFVFRNKNGDRISRQGIWKMIKKYAAKSGIEKRVDSNSFRFAIAQTLVDNGAKANDVNRFLGNKSIMSMERFASPDQKFRSSILQFIPDMKEE